MEEWINLIVLIIFGVVALFTRVLSRRSKAEPDIAPEEEEITLPPWGNLPMEEDMPSPEVIEETAPTTPSMPPPDVQVVSKPEVAKERAQDQPPTDPVIPTIAGIPLSPQTFRQGIILAEILRPPKSLR